jgi:dienelactone hydrolase
MAAMRPYFAALVLLVACARAAQVAAPTPADLDRHNQALIQRGFNVTLTLTVRPEVTRTELWVPSSGEDYEISLWFASQQGEITARLLAADGAEVASWRGDDGERSFRRTLDAGKYVLEVGGAPGSGVVGIKGPIVMACPIDRARVTEHEADPDKGFSWPYLLVAPERPDATTLLVVPNNTGAVTEDVDLLRTAATCELGPAQALADRLGTPLLMPLFPRPSQPGVEEDLYLHALSRAAMTTEVPRFARVDLQLIAMIDDARARLGSAMESRVLIAGFSASGMFSNRFAVLHPERVLAAAVGSPGGWPIAPIRDDALTYPVGIADLGALTGAAPTDAALRQVRFFFYLGADDDNDSVTSRDSFSASDEALVMRRFGTSPVARWDAAKQLYEQAGLDARFELYPGVGHEETPEMQADIEAELRAALRRQGPVGLVEDQ